MVAVLGLRCSVGVPCSLATGWIEESICILELIRDSLGMSSCDVLSGLITLPGLEAEMPIDDCGRGTIFFTVAIAVISLSALELGKLQCRIAFAICLVLKRITAVEVIKLSSTVGYAIQWLEITIFCTC